MRKAQPVVVGVDVGGTKILVGCVGVDGAVHRSRWYPMDRTSQAATLDSIQSAVDDFLRVAWTGPAPLSMGVGLVGHTDPASGTWVHAMNLPIPTPVPLAAQMRERYGLPVWIDNDVHAATLAELRLGAGLETTDFIYLNVGTGLACGIVCNGQLVRGAANYAGELGHMAVEPEGDLCGHCGRRGCLEPIASGGGMLDQVRAQLADYPASLLHEPARSGRLTVADIFYAADARDALASAIAERAVRGLGIALVNLVNLLNPQLIVLGGSVFSEGWGVDRLRAHIAAMALPTASGSLQGIVPSRLSCGRVGLLGAASLAWEHHPEFLEIPRFRCAPLGMTGLSSNGENCEH
jgi:glucokinase